MLMMLGVGATHEKKEAQLMLMMLGPADVHDVGRGCDDAASGKKRAQLMLMMLGVGAASGKR